MVQEFHVLRCHACFMYQVHTVKKVNKWVCKTCNVKQSIIKVYGQGAAIDCRKHVQKLNDRENINRLNYEEPFRFLSVRKNSPVDFENELVKGDKECSPELKRSKCNVAGEVHCTSKWSKYLPAECHKIDVGHVSHGGKISDCKNESSSKSDKNDKEVEDNFVRSSASSFKTVELFPSAALRSENPCKKFFRKNSDEAGDSELKSTRNQYVHLDAFESNLKNNCSHENALKSTLTVPEQSASSFESINCPLFSVLENDQPVAAFSFIKPTEKKIFQFSTEDTETDIDNILNI